MVGQLVEVNWTQRLLTAGWVFPPEITTENLLLSRWKLRRVPRDLWHPTTNGRFNALIDGTSFAERWGEICGLRAPDDIVFLLKFPSGAWDLPWELLIERLLPENQQRVCLIRSTSDSPLVSPSLFDERLRTLILKGAPDGPDLDKLDLEREVELIRVAWESLEFNVRDCIEKPATAEARCDSLSSLLREYRPHVLWFTGHGEAQPRVQLWFADRSWVAGSTFAQLVQESGQCPLYAVFSACDTACKEESGTSPNSPALFEELGKIGVLSILAMQSPIGESSALSMTLHLFRHFAMGLPLERAIARVRAYLIENPPENAHPLDWASPVVWGVGSPVEDRLEWNPDAQKLAQLQVLGRYALGWIQDKPQQLDAVVASDERARAQLWAQYLRLWIWGDIDEAEHRYHWIRTLQAIQSQERFLVVAVEMDSHNPEASLQGWARDVCRRMLPQDFTVTEIPRALARIIQLPIAGWRDLCNLDGVYIAIADPPPYEEGFKWFWEPLLSPANCTRVVVLSNQEIAKSIQADWEIDQMGVGMDHSAIKSVIAKAPRLARALALLNMPLPASYLSISVQKEEGVGSVQEWIERTAVMVDTAAGPIMTATARAYVLKSIDSEQLVRGSHQDCLDILGHSQLSRTSTIREHRFEHLLGAGRDEDALVEANILCDIYHTQDRPYPVLKTIERLGSLRHDLPTQARMIAAWANLQLGGVHQARFWLQRSEPKDPLVIAWKHCLLAEIYKSEGTLDSKRNALNEIEQAVNVCREAEEKHPHNEFIRRKARAYRQDRARIKQYLFGSLQEAAEEYGRLVEEWSDQPDPGIDLAVVKRNYAECLLSLAEKPGNTEWERVRTLLEEAEELARSRPFASALPEILYAKAKFAERERRWTDSLDHLEECKESAVASRHYMMLAIVENRLFWKRECFSMKRWREIETALRGFPRHGWAVRTLICSRLRVARILEDAGDLQGSRSLLKKNLGTLKQNPSFNQGSDRFRIAATMAGLQVIGEKLNEHTTTWRHFLSRYSWAGAWLDERSKHTAQDMWKEVE